MSVRVKRLVKARIGYKHRITVRVSNNNTYAMLVDPDGRTLTEVSTLTPKVKAKIKHGANIDAARIVGQEIGAMVKALKLTDIAFDRSGQLYHGRVAAIADGARESGTKF